VGGGSVAERKIRGLLSAEAAVVVVSPSLTPALRSLAEGGTIAWEPRGYEPPDLEGAFLVFAATDDDATTRRSSPRRARRGSWSTTPRPPSAGISPRRPFTARGR
jgi:precorrin-2 dehydrogenase/sirohydrochlorin ferrochelatase